MSQHAGPSTPDRIQGRPTLGAQEYRDGHPIVPALIWARVIAAGLFALASLLGFRAWAIGLFGLGCISDWLDGVLARRLGAPPRLSPYADAVADLCLVLAALSVLAAKGIYPWWTLLLAGAMFLQFVLTSGLERPVYDPLGKYYGVGLFAIIGLTLLFPYPAVYGGAPAGILLLTGAAVVSRAATLLGRRVPGPSTGITREQDGRSREDPTERTAETRRTQREHGEKHGFQSESGTKLAVGQETTSNERKKLRVLRVSVVKKRLFRRVKERTP